MSLMDKVRWAIPFYGITQLNKFETTRDISTLDKMIYNLGYSALLSFVLIYGYHTKIVEPKRIQQVCEKVGYAHPENVKDFAMHDLNNDGVNDFVLYMKDGTDVKFLSDFRGYKQKE